jgi:hypothetical protein
MGVAVVVFCLLMAIGNVYVALTDGFPAGMMNLVAGLASAFFCGLAVGTLLMESFRR